jgi:S-adenosylmethionine synthetase
LSEKGYNKKSRNTMFEKVNPFHPDKVADRIAGAIVDIVYAKSRNPKIAVEVLIGHGQCNIIVETSEDITADECHAVAFRIGGPMPVYSKIVRQDVHLARNQQDEVRCGDNGIFKGMPVTAEQSRLRKLAEAMAEQFNSDGKYIYAERKLVVCQSNASASDIENICRDVYGGDVKTIINPLGEWTGGTEVDTGATNRKLGSDMGDAVTGGGLHGKDLSKADVTLNILCHLKAQQLGMPVIAFCAIGDTQVTFRHLNGKPISMVPYSDCENQAREYLLSEFDGSFERFAAWGLI